MKHLEWMNVWRVLLGLGFLLGGLGATASEGPTGLIEGNPSLGKGPNSGCAISVREGLLQPSDLQHIDNFIVSTPILPLDPKQEILQGWEEGYETTLSESPQDLWPFGYGLLIDQKIFRFATPAAAQATVAQAEPRIQQALRASATQGPIRSANSWLRELEPLKREIPDLQVVNSWYYIDELNVLYVGISFMYQCVVENATIAIVAYRPIAGVQTREQYAEYLKAYLKQGNPKDLADQERALENGKLLVPDLVMRMIRRLKQLAPPS